MPKQDKTKDGVQFLLANYSWDLPCSMVDTFRDSPLEKTDFTFVRGSQLKAVSLLVVGPRVHFPLSVLKSHLSGTCASIVCMLP